LGLTLIWAFVLAPVAAIFVASVGPGALPSIPPRGFSLHWYQVAFQEADVLAALTTSALVATGSSALALVAGVPAALAIVRYRFRGRGLAEAILALPIILPQIVIGIGLVVLFSRIGVLSSLPQLIVAHAIVISPFTVRIMTATFVGIDTSLEEAAKVFGATAFGAFWRVVVPIARGGLIAAAGISFVISFTQFTVSLFVFSGETKPYPIWMYQALTSDYTPMIPIAVSAMVIVGIVVIVLVLERLSDIASVLNVRVR
jgi:putative spermidine/putrescine transport system permease protein